MRILIIGLSNIGDAVLMSPVIAQAHARWPQAELTLVVGERAQPLFARDPRLARVVSSDEFDGALGRLRLVRWLWRLQPDILLDLRGTMLPLCWRPWQAWRAYWPLPRRAAHMRQRHLLRAGRQLGLTRDTPSLNGGDLWVGDEDRQLVEQLLRRWGLAREARVVVICPGARSHIKRWSAVGFAQVADRIIGELHRDVIFTGAPDEAEVVREVLAAMRHRAYSAVGSTTLTQTAALMGRAALVLTNDSASLHLACAVGTPVVAVFGPTDPRKYGPTGPRDRVIHRRLFCAPCEQALCRFNHECMRFIPPDEVFDTVRTVLHG